MTGQISDDFFYENEEYSLAGMKGSGLPTPQDFGIQPVMMHTACWRGYYCDYTIRDDQLLLTHLVVNSKDRQYPTIGGVAPLYEESRMLEEGEPEPPRLKGRSVGISAKGRHYRYDGAIYPNLALPTHYTGGLLLGKDFLRSMYVHMGFQKPIAYETVIELLFEDGRVTKTQDHSQHVASMRDALMKGGMQLGPGSGESKDEIKDWIEWRFSLDYDL